MFRNLIILAFVAVLSTADTFAFCGFYVAKAKLLTKTSQVIIVRDGLRNVITMSNDFKGNVKDFAMVVPVPVVLERKDIRVKEKSLFTKMDNYSGPRMVEYWDKDPGCPRPQLNTVRALSSANVIHMKESSVALECVTISDSRKYGVRIQARYEVDEYNILILSAKKSKGLEEWLRINGYKIPEGAQEVLEPYIKREMKFFVVKVDKSKLTKNPKGGYDLRPLQIEYKAPQFMLPIRLGMANAESSQDMMVYIMSSKGRVECVNYRTVPIPSGNEIPSWIKGRNTFGEMYKSTFDKAWEQEGKNVVFMEYGWDLSGNISVKCDPCVGNPPMIADLNNAGVDWLRASGNNWQQTYAGNLYFTRLHLRYDREHFPQDLFFQETPNRERFQGRYVIRNAARTTYFDCKKGQKYLRDLHQRREKEVAELAALTGWDVSQYDQYISEFDHYLMEELPEEPPIDDGFLPLFDFKFPGGTSGTILLIGLFSLLLILTYQTQRRRFAFKSLIATLTLLLLYTHANAFCGFYVAKADAKLFNKTSQVIMVRDGQQTTITMSNDYRGELKDFAMVVPVPQVLERKDIRVLNEYLFTRLDNYSGPHLVEYFDEEPCPQPMIEAVEVEEEFYFDAMPDSDTAPTMVGAAKEYGVKVEAVYKVDEYDIVILSAEESGGLEKWLIDNGYKIPNKAREVLKPYIRNKLKFFVVKVNLQRAGSYGNNLRPIQISFESDRFMLPIRLGMANADGDQDMVVYALTRKGRVEVTNYRTLKMPTDRDIPTFVQQKYGEFYKSVFEQAHWRNGRNDVFLEYAWDVSPTQPVKCDPCVDQAPTLAELQQAGVHWLKGYNGKVFFTRLHVRYNRSKFPQDLFFQVTPNEERFQARYVMNHPAGGPFTCDKGQEHLHKLVWQREKELAELQQLTGWNAVADNREYVNQYWRKITTAPQPEVEEDGHGSVMPEGDSVKETAFLNPEKESKNEGNWGWILLPLVGIGILVGRYKLSPQPNTPKDNYGKKLH